MAKRTMQEIIDQADELARMFKEYEPKQRCMIFRRPLPTACRSCGKSTLYCSAVRDLERRPCCDNCLHG